MPFVILSSIFIMEQSFPEKREVHCFMLFVSAVTSKIQTVILGDASFQTLKWHDLILIVIHVVFSFTKMTGSLSSMSSDQSVGVTSSLSSIHPVDACPNIHGFEVRIDSTHNFEEFTLYEIRVTYRYASWKVRRRYREFAELHSELSRVYPGNQMRGHAFPGKRMLGNFSKSTSQVLCRKNAVSAK